MSSVGEAGGRYTEILYYFLLILVKLKFFQNKKFKSIYREKYRSHNQTESCLHLEWAPAAPRTRVPLPPQLAT